MTKQMSTLMASMPSLLLAVLAVPALLAGGLYVLQPAMVFMPYAHLQSTPADWGLAYEDVWLQTDDGIRLHGWYLPESLIRCWAG